MASSDISSDTFDIGLGHEGQDLPEKGNIHFDEHDENPNIPKKSQSTKESSQRFDLKISTDINWADWIHLPNGLWHREGQDSLGNWWQDNQDKDPSSPVSSTGSGQSFDCDNLPDIDWGPWSRLADGQWHREGQDSSGNWQEDNNLPDIEWGPWSRLPNGQWHREGQDSSGNWYEENQDEDSRQPHPQASLDSKGLDQANTGQLVQDYENPSSSRDHENPEQHERSHKSPDRVRSSRSSKGDFREHGGHGKSSKSSRTDAKGKGREIDTQPVNLTTADIYGVDDAGGNDHIPDDPQNLYSIADEYGGEDEPDDELDKVPELPGRASYSKQSRSHALSEDRLYDEDWSAYRVEHSRKFQFGTVFKIMWSEPMGVSRLSRNNRDPVGTDLSISEFGRRNIGSTILYEGIRRFIVVDGEENGARNGNSICVPITTYKRQGCTKRGVKPRQHGVIHTQDTSPMPLNGEGELGYNPIRLVVKRGLQGIEKLAPESRINYSKHVTIEHNSNVRIIGRIHDEDLGILEDGIDSAWKSRIENRKKDKKQRKVRDDGHTSFRLKEDSSGSPETSRNLSERHAPDGMRRESYRPDEGSANRSDSTYRPIPSVSNSGRDKSTEDDDHQSLPRIVGRKSSGIAEGAQETHLSEDPHVTASRTQGSQEELDLKFGSLTISIDGIHDQSLLEDSAEVHSTDSISLSNGPHSPGSSIHLSDTPSHISAVGSHLTTAQRRQVIVQQLIAYVTNLFQTRTQSRGQSSRGQTDSSGHSTRSGTVSSEAKNQVFQANLGTGQHTRPDKKRKLVDKSDEEGSDEEERPPSGVRKGIQIGTQVLYACPYVKRYGSKASCNNNGWPSVARVKEHLYRHHRQAIHCPRCYTTFEDHDALDTHLREQEQVRCASLDKPSMIGFDKRQEIDLKSRKGLSKLTGPEKWERIYLILFPTTQRQKIPSPYFDLNDFREPSPERLLANMRQKLAQVLTYQVTTKLKERHGEDYVSELREDFFEEVLDNAMAEAMAEAVDEAADEAADEAMDEAMDETMDEAMDQATNEEAVGETSKEAVEDAMEKPVEEPVEELMEELMQEPMKEPMEKSMEETAETAEETIEYVVGEAVGKDWGAYSSYAHAEHDNTEGNGVAAESSAVQFSNQMGPVEPSGDTVLDDYTRETLQTLKFDKKDLWNEFLVRDPGWSMSPSSDPSHSGMEFVAAIPNDQQDTGVEKQISDSGLGSSIMGQGPQEWEFYDEMWEPGLGFTEDDQDPSS